MTCYVCGVELPPVAADADTNFRLPPSLWQPDGQGHRFCDECHAQAWAIYNAVGEWDSSEDRDLWGHNCALEGLRRGRVAAMQGSTP